MGTLECSEQQNKARLVCMGAWVVHCIVLRGSVFTDNAMYNALAGILDSN